VPPTGWSGPPEQAGCNAAMFEGRVTFQRPLNVSSLRVLRNWHWIPSVPLHLVIGRGAAIQADIDIGSIGKGTRSFRLEHADWFGFYSPHAANSQFFVNRGGPLDLRLMQPPDSSWLTLWAVMDQPGVGPGETYDYELFGVGCPLDAAAHDAASLRDQVAYLARPERLQVTRGRRIAPSGLLEAQADRYAVHLVVPRPSAVHQLTVPVIVHGLNRRWSAGFWQQRGFVKGDYGSGENRYRSVGVDGDGHAYVPLYPDLAAWTEVEVGHPVSADAGGSNLFIQVTALSGGTDSAPVYEWAVEVNNPTDQPVTTTLRQRMALPNLDLGNRTITLAAGEHRLVYRSAPAPAVPTQTAVTAPQSAPSSSQTQPPLTATRTPTIAVAASADRLQDGATRVTAMPVQTTSTAPEAAAPPPPTATRAPARTSTPPPTMAPTRTRTPTPFEDACGATSGNDADGNISGPRAPIG